MGLEPETRVGLYNTSNLNKTEIYTFVKVVIKIALSRVKTTRFAVPR